MDNINLYQRSMQHKREASSALHKVMSEIELFTSQTDWQAWFEERAATTVNGGWIHVKQDGVLVSLHLGTMTLMADAGGGMMARARWLVDLGQHDNAEKAWAEYRSH